MNSAGLNMKTNRNINILNIIGTDVLNKCLFFNNTSVLVYCIHDVYVF